MPIVQSNYAKRQEASAPIVTEAGQVKTARFKYNFATAFTAVSDKLELGEIPAGAKLVDAILLPTGLTGNITVGLMSGDFGSTDNARTVGAELWSASAVVSTPARLALATGFNVPIDRDNRRSIGVTFSADIPADATDSIELVILYTMP